MSLTETVHPTGTNPFQGGLQPVVMHARSQSILRAFLLGSLMVIAPLSGCIGEDGVASSVDLETA